MDSVLLWKCWLVPFPVDASNGKLKGPAGFQCAISLVDLRAYQLGAYDILLIQILCELATVAIVDFNFT